MLRSISELPKFLYGFKNPDRYREGCFSHEIIIEITIVSNPKELLFLGRTLKFTRKSIFMGATETFLFSLEDNEVDLKLTSLQTFTAVKYATT